MTRPRSSHRRLARTLLVIGAIAIGTPGCAYVESASRSVGAFFGLVPPPPEQRTGGDPVNVPSQVQPASATR